MVLYKDGSPRGKLLILFHGNAEDCGDLIDGELMEDLQYEISDNYFVNVLAMEYPGYGVFTNEIKNG